MKRLEFLKQGLLGLGGMIGVHALLSSKKKNSSLQTGPCEVSPSETRGPFPNKTPLDYVRENIIGNRTGIPLRIELEVLDSSKDCAPVPGVAIDLWHCDNHGKYSEYGNNPLQREDLTAEHFLRGRQLTNALGLANFISIFPGYYPSRAPHIHVEVRDKNDTSLLVSQIAFPHEICEEIYQTRHYDGKDFLPNKADEIFKDSLEQNMTEAITGDITNGFVMKKKLII